jgi:hypothetical protein
MDTDADALSRVADALERIADRLEQLSDEESSRVLRTQSVPW